MYGPIIIDHTPECFGILINPLKHLNTPLQSIQRTRLDSRPRPQLDLRLQSPLLGERREAAPEPVVPDARGDLLHPHIRDEEEAEKGEGAQRRT